MHLFFDLYGANLANEYRHAQIVMNELGISWQHSTPQSILDQWWFWNCKNVPAELPNFVRQLNANPMNCIGWGLDQETAEMIAKTND